MNNINNIFVLKCFSGFLENVTKKGSNCIDRVYQYNRNNIKFKLIILKSVIAGIIQHKHFEI